MNLNGIIIGLCSFLIIGLFHPIVIKVEYYWGKKAWPLFLIGACICLSLSLFSEIDSFYIPSILSYVFAIAGFTMLWSIKELKEQEERVQKGWFPNNPNKRK